MILFPAIAARVGHHVPPVVGAPDGIDELLEPGAVVGAVPPATVVGVVALGVPATDAGAARVNIRPVSVTVNPVVSDTELPVEDADEPPPAEMLTPSTMTSRSNRSNCDR